MVSSNRLVKLNIFLVSLLSITLLFALNTYADGVHWYYANNNWYAMDEFGMLIYNKWVVNNTEEYHLSLDGTMDINKWIDGIYYVDNSGKKLRDTFTPDGYYVNQYGVYDSSIPRYSNMNNQYSNMPITPADVNVINSAVINATNYANSANVAPINNYSILPETNFSYLTNNHGFHLTTIGYSEDNNYYGRHEHRAQYKVIDVRLTTNYQQNYFLNDTRLDQINEALESVCNDFEQDAIDALERDNIKKYFINKAELTKLSYTNIVIIFTGYMTTFDNDRYNLRYRFTYFPYDDYYTLEEDY